jgi:hypothetical protein
MDTLKRAAVRSSACRSWVSNVSTSKLGRDRFEVAVTIAAPKLSSEDNLRFRERSSAWNDFSKCWKRELRR